MRRVSVTPVAPQPMAPAPQAPVLAANADTLESDPAIASLHAMFPAFDLMVLQSVLEATGGDKDQAVDSLLSMSDPDYAPSQQQAAPGGGAPNQGRQHVSYSFAYYIPHTKPATSRLKRSWTKSSRASLCSKRNNKLAEVLGHLGNNRIPRIPTRCRISNTSLVAVASTKGPVVNISGPVVPVRELVEGLVIWLEICSSSLEALSEALEVDPRGEVLALRGKGKQVAELDTRISSARSQIVSSYSSQTFRCDLTGD